MPIYEPVEQAEIIEKLPSWVYFDERRDRDTITIKTAGLTRDADGRIKAGVALVQDTDGTYKAAPAGTAEKPTVAAGLLLFDVYAPEGAKTVPGVLFTRGTVAKTMPKLAANVVLPATIRVK